jgi:hypothetical protein
MELSEITQLINNVFSDEVRNAIINESEEKNNKEVYHIKMNGEPVATFKSKEQAEEELPKYQKKSTGDLIIEKGVYESYSDMIEKFDEMGQELEEKENLNMKNQEPMEGNAFSVALLKAKEEGKDKFVVDGQEYDVEESWTELEESELSEGNEEDCNECNEEISEGQECNECGGEMKEGVCNECGTAMNENKTKKVLRLKESEMVNLIKKIVSESIPTATTKAQSQTKKDNESHAKEVANKIKKSQSFEGNDNPEFPKPIGKGDKVAHQNTKEQDEIVADNRGGGLEDLDYAIEPSEAFKDRLKKSLEGHSTMGNSQDAANVIKSDLGKKISDKVERKKEKETKEFEVSWGHAWKSPEKVVIVKESETKFKQILNEEIEKMKKIASYDKKTQ